MLFFTIVLIAVAHTNMTIFPMGFLVSKPLEYWLSHESPQYVSSSLPSVLGSVMEPEETPVASHSAVVQEKKSATVPGKEFSEPTAPKQKVLDPNLRQVESRPKITPVPKSITDHVVLEQKEWHAEVTVEATGDEKVAKEIITDNDSITVKVEAISNSGNYSSSGSAIITGNSSATATSTVVVHD